MVESKYSYKQQLIKKVAMILKERYEEYMEELGGGIKGFKVIIISKYKKLLKIKSTCLIFWFFNLYYYENFMNRIKLQKPWPIVFIGPCRDVCQIKLKYSLLRRNQ